MKVKIENKYSVKVVKEEDRVFTCEFDYVLSEYLDSTVDTFETEKLLLQDFKYFLNDVCDLLPESFKKDEELNTYSMELTVVNWDLIRLELIHLVKSKTCCDKAPHKANFCPTCGKSLHPCKNIF